VEYVSKLYDSSTTVPEEEPFGADDAWEAVGASIRAGDITGTRESADKFRRAWEEIL
jgi:hypothetical protein